MMEIVVKDAVLFYDRGYELARVGGKV